MITSLKDEYSNLDLLVNLGAWEMWHCTVTADFLEHCNYSPSLLLQAAASCRISAARLKALYKVWGLFDLR